MSTAGASHHGAASSTRKAQHPFEEYEKLMKQIDKLDEQCRSLQDQILVKQNEKADIREAFFALKSKLRVHYQLVENTSACGMNTMVVHSLCTQFDALDREWEKVELEYLPLYRKWTETSDRLRLLRGQVHALAKTIV